MSRFSSVGPGSNQNKKVPTSDPGKMLPASKPSAETGETYGRRSTVGSKSGEDPGKFVGTGSNLTKSGESKDELKRSGSSVGPKETKGVDPGKFAKSGSDTTSTYTVSYTHLTLPTT
eukprot:TRINITY_DN1835_c0_g1_i6.p1 TRINITY_DN1835_c0_g1~~TRINITY_DN1835_c0_g1_i6.p1  ORF type:complete len:117 (-),score=27.19 TRINITY_DN1835_c0_g1_i6:30-380(-)